jgi:hypothetical protein
MLIGIVAAVLILGIITVILLRYRKGPVARPIQLSHLKCPKCNSEFDYAYLPGASFT